jgi:hypothetical protein
MYALLVSYITVFEIKYPISWESVSRLRILNELYRLVTESFIVSYYGELLVWEEDGTYLPQHISRLRREKSSVTVFLALVSLVRLLQKNWPERIRSIYETCCMCTKQVGRKIVPIHANNAYRTSRVIAPCVLDLYSKMEVSVLLRCLTDLI